MQVSKKSLPRVGGEIPSISTISHMKYFPNILKLVINSVRSLHRLILSLLTFLHFSKSIYLMEFSKKMCFCGKYSLKYLISRPFRIFIFEGFEIINCLYLVCLSRLKSEFLSSFRGSFLKTHFSRYF